MPDKLEILLFGQPIIRIGKTKITVDTRKAIALIAYLAVKNQPVSRDVLCNLFWTDYPEHNARSSLRRTLSVTNSALNKEWLVSDGNSISLTESSNLFVDVNRFKALITQVEQHEHGSNLLCETCCNHLADAVQSYRDDFLAGFNLRDSINFEQWHQVESEGLQRQLGGALEKLVYWYMNRKDFEKAAAYAIRWLRLDPLHEEANFALMTIYAESGQRTASLRQYQSYAALLENELGISPLKETMDFYKKLRTIPDSHPSTSEFTDKRDKTANIPKSHNLPVFSTQFVGREKELQEIVVLLGSNACQLLTLIGSSGIGKTRLAIEVIQETQVENVVFLSLSEAEFDSQVETFFHKIDNLVTNNNLANQYIILDGFENHLSHLTLIQQLLSAPSNFKILVTSQIPLNIQQEWIFNVQGLENLDAVALFIDRAEHVDPKFSTPLLHLRSIQEICHRVSGVPVLIELAAHMTQFMPCDELLKELISDPTILNTSLQDLPPRHRSLQTLFEYTWKLLDQDEKAALEKLAIFEDGFDKSAVQNVTEIPFTLLSQILKKSVLTTDQNGRYHICYPLYPYVRHLVQQDLETYARLQEKHAAHYSTLMENQAFDTKESAKALEWFTSSLHDISAAWNWAITHHDFSILQRSLHSLFSYYETLTLFKEGQEIFSQSLRELDFAPLKSKEKMQVVSSLMTRDAVFHCHLGNYDIALEQFYKSLDLAKSLSMWEEVAFIQNYIGIIYTIQGRYLQAKDFLNRSLEIYEELNIPTGIAKVLNNMGILANYQGEYQQAISVLMRSLTIYKKLEIDRFIAYTFNNLGKASLGLENYPDAENFFKESYRIKEILGDYWGCACALINIGQIAELRIDHTSAYDCYRKSLEMSDGIGKQNGVIIALSHLGNLAVETHDDRNGVRYFLKALSLIQETGLQSRLADSLVGISTLFIRLGKRSEAKRFLQQVAYDPQALQNSRERAKHILRVEFHTVEENGFVPISRDQILKEILLIEHRWALEM